uniref:Uncharacterized protein n=1 Tax=Cairina moschata TaxID=8855 RepID=A0A8C3D019_CAIMO
MSCTGKIKGLQFLTILESVLSFPSNGDPDVIRTRATLHERLKGTQLNKSSLQLDFSFSPGTSPEGQVSGWALTMGANLSTEEEAIVNSCIIIYIYYIVNSCIINLEEFLNFKQLKTSSKEENFSLMQLSGFMDLLNFLLESLRDKHMTLGDNIKELGKAMQAKAIIDYLNINLFKPYKLYEYLFHSPREELVISNKYVIELAPPAVTPFPPLLEEGVPSQSCASLILLPIAAEMESKGSDQEGHLEEPCPEAESLEAGAVAAFPVEDQKSAVDGIPSEIIVNLEAEINEKL